MITLYDELLHSQTISALAKIMPDRLFNFGLRCWKTRTIIDFTSWVIKSKQKWRVDAQNGTCMGYTRWDTSQLVHQLLYILYYCYQYAIFLFSCHMLILNMSRSQKEKSGKLMIGMKPLKCFSLVTYYYVKQVNNSDCKEIF